MNTTDPIDQFLEDAEVTYDDLLEDRDFDRYFQDEPDCGYECDEYPCRKCGKPIDAALADDNDGLCDDCAEERR